MSPLFASLFTGGGGADLGAIAAGLMPTWGIEVNPAIAEVARANLKHDVVVADVLTLDPKRFERVDILHASPPCPSFSAAKTGGTEMALDIALAKKVAEFVRVLRPAMFTLENVEGYKRSKSWAIIQETLYRCGYWLHVDVLNAADYGVPQSRRRLIARAVRNGYVPSLPVKSPRTGWYDAIADLLDDLPECKFAAWQLERLPEKLTTMLVSSNSSHFDGGTERGAHFTADEPAMTVLTGTAGRARAFIVHPTSFQTMPVRADHEPVFTCMAGTGNLNMPRAYLVGEQTGASLDGKKGVQLFTEDKPAPTLLATSKGKPRALLETGRVVKMTPPALARFQSFPDNYTFPDKKTLACKIIGNACPPLLMRQIYEGLTS